MVTYVVNSCRSRRRRTAFSAVLMLAPVLAFADPTPRPIQDVPLPVRVGGGGLVDIQESGPGAATVTGQGRVDALTAVETLTSIPIAAQELPRACFPSSGGKSSDAERGTFCLIDSDCDDCNPCTLDSCLSSVCSNVLIPPDEFVPGSECDDGLDCNGWETCAAGACVPGVPLCGDGWVCNESNQSCDLPCLTDEACQTDGLACTIEVCDVMTCWGGTADGAPCRSDVDCPGGTCGGGGTGACLVTSACGPGADCVESGDGTVTCPVGRCCDLGVCTCMTRADCTLAGGDWLAIDVSETCDDILAPLYSSGIAPQGTFSVAVGSVVSSASCVGPFTQVGDDYWIPGDPFVELTTVRWAGGVEQAGDVVAFEWYDVNGVFIEDAYVSVGRAGTAIHTFDLPVPLIIPSEGFMVVRVAEPFSPGARIHWLATVGVDVGANDSSTMWVNGSVRMDGFLGRCEGGLDDGGWCDVSGGPTCSDGTCADVPDVLAFELVGLPASNPARACCDSSTGSCLTELPWVCRDNGYVSQAEGVWCKACSHDRTYACENDAECLALGNICEGGDADGELCAFPEDCPLGFCTGLPFCLPQPPACSAEACCDPVTGSCLATALSCVNSPDPAIPLPCAADVDCPGGIPGTCINQFGMTECPPGTVGNGFGSTCDPNGCAQPVVSGGDDCVAAVATAQAQADFAISVPGLGQPPVTVTRTGRNGAATFGDYTTGLCVGGTNDGNPCDPLAPYPDAPCLGAIDGTCEALCGIDIFDPGGSVGDPGWWEAFAVDDCAEVRIDLCATDPVLQPAWGELYSGCPCQTVIANQSVEPPAGLGWGEASSSFGSPYCSEDNAWQTFGQLPAGTYYYPIYSAPSGTFAVPPGGEYQMHITVSACTEAACCSTLCDGGARHGLVCNPAGSEECTGGECVGGICVGGSLDGFSCDLGTGVPDWCPAGTCSVQGCERTTELSCDVAGGLWLGGEDYDYRVCLGGDHDGFACSLDADCTAGGSCVVQEPVVDCASSPCDTGACCLGGGECVDEFPPDSGLPLTAAGCGGLGGSFTGGTRCGFEPALCPVCDIEGPDNCQPTDAAFVLLSDLDADTRVAENFTPVGTTVSQVCAVGAWIDASLPGPRVDCACRFDDVANCIPSVADDFVVTIYDDFEGQPGAVVGSSTVSTPPRGLVYPFVGFDLWDLSLTLDSPITGLAPGSCHWIEIVNNTTDHPASCNWYWASSAGVGDSMSLAGDASGPPDVEVAFDMALCLDTDFAQPACGVRTGACCDCDGACVDGVTADNCSVGTWHVDQNCIDIACPVIGTAGDDCGSEAQAIVGITTPFHNLCATLDGPGAVACEDGTKVTSHDVWFEYTASCDALLVVSLCDGTDFDALVSIYGDGTGICSCPSDLTRLEACDDNSCADVGGLSGSGVGPLPCGDPACGAAAPMLWIPAVPGSCHTIQISGVDGARGSGNLDVVCVGSIVYVDETATGANDGTSWTDAFTELQDAMRAAQLAAASGALSFAPQVWVAQGTYKPDRGTGDRTASFRLASGVRVLGGFVGDEAAVSLRNYTANPTILSGDIGVGGDASDNSYHVVTAEGASGTVLLDGFIIEGGNADGVARDDVGGGLVSGSVDVNIANVIFRANGALQGGGLYNATGDLSLVNCVFTGNMAGDSGGGVYAAGGNVTLENCTLSGNTATLAGGYYAGHADYLTLDNSIAAGNVGGPTLFFEQGFAATGLVTARYCCVEGYTGIQLAGVGNIGDDPLFVDADGLDGVLGTEDDNVKLMEVSPCIDAGDSTLVPTDTFDTDGDGDAGEAFPRDLESNARAVDAGAIPDKGRGCPAVVDMGAYEYPPDCNHNGIPDPVDIHVLGSNDCNSNRIPDECEIKAPCGGSDQYYCEGDCPDCNGNCIPDDCDFPDCNGNSLPDECEIDESTSAPDGPYYCPAGDPTCDPDCNANGVPDECDIASCPSGFPQGEECDDCNQNTTPDGCDISEGTSPDFNADHIPDECLATETDAAGPWSSGGNWVGGAPPGASSSATLENSATLNVDVNVNVDALRIQGDSTLTLNEPGGVGTGDLTVTTDIQNRGSITVDAHLVEAASVELDGEDSGSGGRLGVSGAASLNLRDGELTIANGGSFRSDDPPDLAEANVIVGTTTIGTARGGACSMMALRDSMLVDASGDVVLDGRASQPLFPCMLSNTAAAMGGKTPPIMRVSPPTSEMESAALVGEILSPSLIVGGSFIMYHGAEVCVGGASDSPGCPVDPDSDIAGVDLSGDFDNQSIYPSMFNWERGYLRMLSSGSAQSFEVGGLDLGQTSEGFETDELTTGERCLLEGVHTNFSMYMVEIGNSADVTFQNLHVNTAGTGPCAEALYVDTLIIHPGAQVTLDNCRVYYRFLDNNSEEPITMNGCGQLLRVDEPPVVPGSLEPVLDRGVSGDLVPAYHNRYLSVTGGSTGQPAALRVTLVSLPAPFDAWNGEVMWVGEPRQYNELPGKGNECVLTPGHTDECTVATFWAAELQCDPYYGNWTSFAANDSYWDGSLNIYGEAIVPSLMVIPAGPIGLAAIYELQLVGYGGSTYGDVLLMRTSGWGDVVELVAGGYRIPPDVPGAGITVADTLAMLQKFAGLPCYGGEPSKVWMDLVGVTTGQVPELDRIIDVNDLTTVLDAFTGTSYPFGPPWASPCGPLRMLERETATGGTKPGGREEGRR